MKKIFLTSLLIFLSISLFAQFGESIRTGRPGQAAGIYTLGKDVFQLQTGFTFNPSSTDNSQSNTLSQALILRYGLSEQFEISGVTGWKNEQTNYDNTNESTQKSGIYTTQLGFRFHIMANKGAIPGVGVQYRVLFNAQSNDFRPPYLGGKLLVMTKSAFGSNYALITNWGLLWSGNPTAPTGSYVINNSFSISDKIGTFIELYGNFLTNRTTPNQDTPLINLSIDAGISYLINKDLQLDLSAGLEQLNVEASNSSFIDLGLSWRLHNR